MKIHRIFMGPALCTIFLKINFKKMDRYVSFFESSKNFHFFSKIREFSKMIHSDLSDRKLVHMRPTGPQK